MNPSYYAVIMAGGVGSRFWPGSREEKPKQFLDMLGTGKSLLRMTFERLLPLIKADHIFVLTHDKYRDLVAEHLPEIDHSQILGEPSRNNTAPCIAYAALKIKDLDPNATFVVAPSDHVILKEETFRENLATALQFASTHDALCTLGITPVRPDTGYGYIHYGEAAQGTVHKVLEFREKPDLETARQYLESGDYLWNAGIFVWSAKAVIQALETHSPQLMAVFSTALNGVWNTSQETTWLQQWYPTTPNISIDYAIMEKASNVYTIPADIGWSDLGTWASLHSERQSPDSGNVIDGNQILALDVTNCLIRAPHDKLLVIKDLDNYIIVDEGDVLLVWPKEKEQEIKNILATVRNTFGDAWL
jgi:mannose-1-phosphate guanylyltransferase